jgi:hypothetical protein
MDEIPRGGGNSRNGDGHCWPLVADQATRFAAAIASRAFLLARNGFDGEVIAWLKQASPSLV